MSVETVLSVYFEIFDTSNENEYITCADTYEMAVDIAKENPAYAVDMVIDLQNTDGESLPTSGDYLYTMQVYPTVKQYDNHDMNPTLEV